MLLQPHAKETMRVYVPIQSRRAGAPEESANDPQILSVEDPPTVLKTMNVKALTCVSGITAGCVQGAIVNTVFVNVRTIVCRVALLV